jgi:hypothetical protein
MTLTTGAAFGTSCPVVVVELSFEPQAVISRAAASVIIVSLLYFIDLCVIISRFQISRFVWLLAFSC